MEKRVYVELIQNQTVLIRDVNRNRMMRRLKGMNLQGLCRKQNIRVVEMITNIKKPIGSVFEGTI